MYFWFVVTILKDGLAVNSNSIYLAYVSSISPKTETTSAFLSAIFISGVTVTPGDVNIIGIKKANPDNIGIALGIFLWALETK